MNAFRVLDEKNAKCLNKADFTDKLTSKGEPLNAEELNEMMTIATNPETDDTILYEYYINYLMVRFLTFLYYINYPMIDDYVFMLYKLSDD